MIILNISEEELKILKALPQLWGIYSGKVTEVRLDPVNPEAFAVIPGYLDWDGTMTVQKVSTKEIKLYNTRVEAEMSLAASAWIS